jgi:hypothetical protein
MHPLVLGIALPLTMSTPSHNSLYRAIVNPDLTTASSNWLHLRTIALLALANTITTSPPASKTLPTNLWEMLHRTVGSSVTTSKHDEEHVDKDKLEKGAKTIGDMVDWVERVIVARGEDREAWFQGKAWTALMDLWISLGRRVSLFSASPLIMADCSVGRLGDN